VNTLNDRNMTARHAPMLALTCVLLAAGCAASDDAPLSTAQPIYSGPAESPFRYPEALWDEGVEGETMLMVHVTPEGGVDSAYVERSSGRSAMDSAALAGAPALRFQPARRGSEAVDVWVRLPVRFSMDGGAAAAASVAPAVERAAGDSTAVEAPR